MGKLYNLWSEERKQEHRVKQALRGIKRRKELLIAYGNKCTICGYDKCDKALQFHHIHKETKMFSLDSRSLASHSMNSILEEVKKCILVCANCHTEIHSMEYDDLYKQEYKYRIKKVDKFCIDCDIKISKSATRCDKCQKKISRKVLRPSYEELKEQLSKYTYIQVGKFYGVSDNSIRKWLKYYNNTGV